MISAKIHQCEVDNLAVCSDFDEDCEDVKDKPACWLYMPECGICPYLYNKEKE